jgi:cystathionine gamma-synthase
MLQYQEQMSTQGTAFQDEYARYGNPTQLAAEQKLAEIEGGEASLLFASGMSAVTTALFVYLGSGEHLVMTDDCYRKTRFFCSDFLARYGVETSIVPAGDYQAMQDAMRPDTRLVLAESPTNPYLRVLDIPRAAKIAHDGGAELLVDSTFATPFNVRPLDLGADIVMHSTTKYLSGHNDVLGGVLIGSWGKLRPIKDARGMLGGVIAPQSSYLLLRGLKTFGLRMKHLNDSAMQVAQFLQTAPQIATVHYPGLPEHPDYAVAAEQMAGFGGVVSFEVDGGLELTSRLVDLVQIPQLGPSFGGTESLIIQPALQTYYDLTTEQRLAMGIRDNLVRYAVGLEDTADLIADLAQALDTICCEGQDMQDMRMRAGPR